MQLDLGIFGYYKIKMINQSLSLLFPFLLHLPSISSLFPLHLPPSPSRSLVLHYFFPSLPSPSMSSTSSLQRLDHGKQDYKKYFLWNKTDHPITGWICSVAESSLPSMELLYETAWVMFCTMPPAQTDKWVLRAIVSGLNLLQKKHLFLVHMKMSHRGPGIMRLPFLLLHGCNLYEVLFQ